MELTREYDFGVYGRDEDTVSLTAYKVSKNEEGYWETNYDNDFISLVLTRQSDEDIIKWLVERNGWSISYYEEYMTEDYTDYDAWLEQSDLTTAETPHKISNWVNNLPEYELRTME
jgi:hypothetical protein